MSNVPRIVSASRPCLALALLALGCGEMAAEPARERAAAPTVPPAPAPLPEPEPEPALVDPVPVWEHGEVAGEVERARAEEEGYLLLDLGEEWTPILFSDVDPATGEQVPNDYRRTYLALARGERPPNHHGARAERDKYLELYGILPTLGVLRERFRRASGLECAEALDYGPLLSFEGFIAYRNNDRARRAARRFDVLERQLGELVAEQGLSRIEELDAGGVPARWRRRLREYRELQPTITAVRATQERLECEGFFEGKGRFTRGAMDWPTHEALAELERRHRVYGWGFIGRDTLGVLRRTPVEAEQEAVLRVLTERAMHAAGVIEDGSRSFLRDAEPRTYEGADGQRHPIPNLEADLREAVRSAFGLESPESALAFLDALGELPEDEERIVAIRPPPLPEYYAGAMELEVEIDRGDVWYEFPFDENGEERAQPVQRRPRLTIYTRYRGQKIPLARHGTTIGGWRSELVDGTVMWKYKQSEVGPRVWAQIVASPVWLPPETTPARELLTRTRRGDAPFAVNYHETGPSYASAYGLVAAYHRLYRRDEEGNVVLGGDEGIRTHGSVDYMSIMRRHSHGCHRLHNHIAVRLMSFVVKRRPHQRRGQQTLAFRRDLEHEGRSYLLAVDRGGYVFELDEPLRVRVLPGRIRGSRRTPIEHPLPKWNAEIGSYVMPDGQTVTVNRNGDITPIELDLVVDAEGLPVLEGEGTLVEEGGQIPGPSPEGDAAPPSAATPVLVQPTF
ncbi:MAG: hypothetical protein AAGH15_26035 [Myxococcota bacterium]